MLAVFVMRHDSHDAGAQLNTTPERLPLVERAYGNLTATEIVAGSDKADELDSR